VEGVTSEGANVSADEIVNPRTGERIVFRDAGADVLRFDYAAAPGAAGPPEHIHLDQEERFALTAGEARFRVGGRDVVLRAGESASVPPGTPHTFANAGDVDLRMTIEIEPAKNMRAFFETLFALGRAGKTDARGRAGLLQDAVLAHEHGVFLARPAVWLQRPVIVVLAAVGRMFGKQAKVP
jgi:mannose-6-phosphate isomerase-like protein (cupin superfamily)